MDIIQQFLNAGIGNFLILIIVIIVLKRNGISIKGLFNGNGTNAKLKEIEENHLHHINEKLDKLISLQMEHNIESKMNQGYLKDKIKELCIKIK